MPVPKWPKRPTRDQIRGLLVKPLSAARGAKRSITRDALLFMLETEHGVRIHERLCRQVLKELVEDYGFPLAAQTEKPYGYFVPTTAEEVVHYRRDLLSRMRSLRYRLDRFDAAMSSPLDEVLARLAEGKPLPKDDAAQPRLFGEEAG